MSQRLANVAVYRLATLRSVAGKVWLVAVFCNAARCSRVAGGDRTRTVTASGVRALNFDGSVSGFHSFTLAIDNRPSPFPYHFSILVDLAAYVDRNQREVRPKTSIISLSSALISGISADDRVFDAMRDVVAKHLLLNAAQRGSHRGDLRDMSMQYRSSSTMRIKPRTCPSIPRSGV